MHSYWELTSNFPQHHKNYTACPIVFVKAFQGLSFNDCESVANHSPSTPTQWSPTLAPASYTVHTHTYTCTRIRKSQGSTARQCNIVIGARLNPAKNTVFPYACGCVLHFTKRLRASQIERSTSRKDNTVMGRLPNLHKHSVSLPSPFVLHCAYTYISMYAHRKSQGSTCRKCNMVMGNLPSLTKTQRFPALAPAVYILATAYAHCKSQGSTAQVVEEFPRGSTKMISFETHRAKHIISYHRAHIVVQWAALSMSSRLHKWICSKIHIWKNIRKRTMNNKKRINV